MAQKEWDVTADPFACLGPKQVKKIDECFIENNALKAEAAESAENKVEIWPTLILTSVLTLIMGYSVGVSRK